MVKNLVTYNSWVLHVGDIHVEWSLVAFSEIFAILYQIAELSKLSSKRP